MQMANRGASSVLATTARSSLVLGPRMMRTSADQQIRDEPAPQAVGFEVAHRAVIEHCGRKSGTGYQTPVMAFVEDGRLSVVLNYGKKSDWVRNVFGVGLRACRRP